MRSDAPVGFIVLPAFNEGRDVASFLETLHAFLSSAEVRAGDYRFRILVVNDGSLDETAFEVERISRKLALDEHGLEMISFTRNFGHQAALVAGMLHAVRQRASFVITMDADGEHPIELIPRLIDAWEAGSLVVHTLRAPHPGLGRFKRWTSAAHYKVLSAMSGVEIRPGMADFKLWDGALVHQVRDFLPVCGSIRAFASWLYPHGAVIPYAQGVCRDRRSRVLPSQMLSLAVGGIVRYSVMPLRISLLFGFLSIVFSILFSAFVILSYYRGQTLGGWASLVLTVTITSGLQAVMIGCLGEYLLRNVFSSGLPRFVVSNRPCVRRS